MVTSEWSVSILTFAGALAVRQRYLQKENGPIRKKIGNPDLLILFTNTVSHKMVLAAAQEAKRNNIPVRRVEIHKDAAGVEGVLNEYCG